MVALLHRADVWPSVRLILTFSRLSDTVMLHRPLTAHTLRSSFYMVLRGCGLDARLRCGLWRDGRECGRRRH